MKIYLDDDSASSLLVQFLIREGHDVVTPKDVGTSGRKDPSHFMYAISNGRALLTHNQDDFELLHKLVLLVRGHHPGILVVRKDNDRKRDVRPKQIVRAIRNLMAAAGPIQDELNVLNSWR